MTENPIAYCGVPPVPENLFAAWNFDPLLLAGLFLFGVLVHLYAQSRRAGWAALLLMVLIFVSPLCALTSALFSARVFHHVVLIALIAPLVVLAFPMQRLRPPASLAFIFHLLILWMWHLPAAYQWGLETVWGYWLMQATLFGSAYLIWAVILDEKREKGASLGLLLGTVAQMGFLAALIVFAPEPLYEAHFLTTFPWGLSPLEDQQLAGLLMWVPASLPYLAMAVHQGLQLLPEEDGEVRANE